jgi:processive 1,2-diacylglycerol beta-glucosyltransferase
MSTQSPKILIVYASYGDGHYQASKAIEKCFRTKGIHHISSLDLMATAHPLLNELTKRVYIQSFKTLPGIYGWVYNITKEMQSDTSVLNMINTVGMGTLKTIISKEEPDLIIHTFPQLVMPTILKKTGKVIPLVNVITDFDLHGRWLHSSVDRYYVATEDLKAQMETRGIPGHRILASGIPLGQHFDPKATPSAELLHRLDPTKKTVLLMAGAYGVMKGLRDVCHALIKGGQHQVLVVCGRNKELFRQMQHTFQHSPDIHLYGYVNEMMAISDCIITKPGGITLSESLAFRLPLFFYRPVPGQELNNALYLKAKGVARIVYQAEQLASEIESLWADNSRFDRIHTEIENLRRPEATEVIVNDIIDHWFPYQLEQTAIMI